MPYPLVVVQNYTLAGKSYNLSQTINKPDVRGKADTLPIAFNGTITTHTSTTAGVITTDNPAPVIAGGDHIDIYWLDANGEQQFARDALVASVVGNVVTFSTALGTAIPAVATVVQAAVVKSFALAIIGDNCTSILASCDGAAAMVVLLDTGGTLESLVAPIIANGCYGWVSGTNPIAGKSVDTVHMSHNNITTPVEVRVAAHMTV